MLVAIVNETLITENWMKIVILGRTKIVELGGERKNPNIIQIVISKIIENYFSIKEYLLLNILLLSTN